jgi:hypothetical protein
MEGIEGEQLMVYITGSVEQDLLLLRHEDLT